MKKAVYTIHTRDYLDRDGSIALQELEKLVLPGGYDLVDVDVTIEHETEYIRREEEGRIIGKVIGVKELKFLVVRIDISNEQLEYVSVVDSIETLLNGDTP